MNGENRRKKIYATLLEGVGPVSASKLAESFHVSRQIIVGDIALMRAAGLKIIATARGYILETPREKQGLAKIACQHHPSETQKELEIIVLNGGEIVDVLVEHPLYGELSGKLEIATLEEVALFVEKYHQKKTSLLSELTGGVHLHTIRYQEPANLAAIKAALAAEKILYQAE